MKNQTYRPLRRLLAVLLCVLLLPLFPPASAQAAQPDVFGDRFANSDTTADVPGWSYELDPGSGALLRRQPEQSRAECLLTGPFSQMALLDGVLYLLRTDDDALLRYDPEEGSAAVLRTFDAAVTRFAVTDSAVYYLSGETIRCSALEGSRERVVVSETGLYRFWLDDGSAIEYMCSPAEICRLELADGRVTRRINNVSTLQSGLRTTEGIDRLKLKFPAGKYWNHCGGPNNPDGWTEEPCTHHGYHGSGCGLLPNQCNCNSFHESIQCFGFAYKLTDDYFGSTPDEWDNRIWWNCTAGMKAGDVLRFKNNTHTIWITSVDGDQVTYADCNYNGTCVIRWDQTASIYTLRSSATFRDVAPVPMDQGGMLATPVVTGLPAAVYDDMQITLQWDTVKNAAAYRVCLEKDGQTLIDRSGEDRTLTLRTPACGDYVLQVWSFDAVGRSQPCRLTFSVRHVERETAAELWFSRDEDGMPEQTLLSGDQYWLQYRLYDRTTGQSLEEYCFDFAAGLTVIGPDGRQLAETTPATAATGAVPFAAAEAGEYSGVLSVTGGEQLQAEAALTCREPTCADLGHSWQYSKAEAADDCVCLSCSICGTERRYLLPGSCPGAGVCPGAGFTDMPAEQHWAHAGLEFLLQNGLMNGISAVSLGPDQQMNRAMLVTLLWRIEGEPSARRLQHFADVKQGSYYAQAVAWAVENGIVNGISPTQFAPYSPITREQLATILHRYSVWRGFAGEKSEALTTYPDQNTVSNFARQAMEWAVGSEIINGIGTQGQTLLRPKHYATRAQVATILLRLLQLPSQTAAQTPAEDSFE